MINRQSADTVSHLALKETFCRRCLPGHGGNRNSLRENLACEICPYSGIGICSIVWFRVGIDQKSITAGVPGIEKLSDRGFLGDEIRADALVLEAGSSVSERFINPAFKCRLACGITHDTIGVNDLHRAPVLPFLEIVIIGVCAASDGGDGNIHSGFYGHDVYISSAQPVGNLPAPPRHEFGIIVGGKSGASGLGVETGDGGVVVTCIAAQISDVIHMNAVNVIIGHEVHHNAVIPLIGAGAAGIKQIVTIADQSGSRVIL